MSTDTREERLARRISDLYATDPQFAAARPSEISRHRRSKRPSCRCPRSFRPSSTAMPTGPRSGSAPSSSSPTPRRAGHRRSCSPVSKPSPTASCRTGSSRSRPALTQNPVQPGDRVAILGFTSIDYTTVDMALLRLGAVSVPLQTSAPVAQLRPIAAETEPVVIASSVDFLDDAVELMLTGHLPQRLVVFDYHGEVDDHREALEAATARLAGTPVVVETLADVFARGNTLPPPPLRSTPATTPPWRCSSTPRAAPARRKARCTPRRRSPTHGGGPAWRCGAMKAPPRRSR